jgi:hypothetical protein
MLDLAPSEAQMLSQLMISQKSTLLIAVIVVEMEETDVRMCMQCLLQIIGAAATIGTQKIGLLPLGKTQIGLLDMISQEIILAISNPETIIRVIGTITAQVMIIATGIIATMSLVGET